MNEIIRRIVMMIGIVAIGTILIFFNTSIIITLSATLAFGIIMAMGIGLLKKEDFKRLSNLKISSIKNIVHKKDSKKSESKKPEPKKELNTDKNRVKQEKYYHDFTKKRKRQVRLTNQKNLRKKDFQLV